MNTPLVVIAPQIGALSETFIQRHMSELLPGGTAVVARKKDGFYAGHWDVEGPQLLLDRLPPGWKLYRKASKLIGRGRSAAEVDIAAQFCRRQGVQAILGEYLDSCLLWLPLARSLGVPFYAHAHGCDISERLRDPLWRDRYRQLNQATGIITMSQLSRQRLIETGLSPEKTHVIPYGVEVPPQPPQRPARADIRCLAVGRMVAKKAPLLTLEAFRIALDRVGSLELDYVGAGPLLPDARQYVQTTGLGECVRLHGARPHTFVRQLLERADIFLQHSLTDPETGDEEGLPVSILEAMAAALPVVSTRHAGIPEAVVEEETGILVDEGAAAAMAAALVRLARNADLRASMGAAGWQRARARFSTQLERQSLLQLLQLDGES